MDHCAIDLGGRESQVCIRRSNGEIAYEARWATPQVKKYLCELPKARVIVETCAEAFGVADAALEAGHEVRVVPATLVRTLGVGARKLKTDLRDARVLSEVSCRIDLPSVHVPSRQSREWKTITGMRDVLIRSQTRLVNNLRGWLRGQGLHIRGGRGSTFAARIREMERLPSYIETQLQVLDCLREQIKTANAQVEKLAHENSVCMRLMSTPGIGPITALRFVAALDRVDRFSTAHQVESYVGLVPGEHSSSDSQQRLSITKAGAPALRWALVEAAWSLRVRCRSQEARPLQLWALEVEKRRGGRIATVALARKLAGILYALWRDGTTYDARLASAQ